MHIQDINHFYIIYARSVTLFIFRYQQLRYSHTCFSDSSWLHCAPNAPLFLEAVATFWRHVTSWLDFCQPSRNLSVPRSSPGDKKDTRICEGNSKQISLNLSWMCRNVWKMECFPLHLNGLSVFSARFNIKPTCIGSRVIEHRPEKLRLTFLPFL